MTERMPSFCVAVQAAPVAVMSATQVMPLESASRPPRMAESYAHVHLRALLQHGRDPGGVGHVVHDAAHDGVLQVSVQVDQARHERGQAVVDDLLVGVAELQHVGGADVADAAVAHEHGAVLERL